MKNFIKTLLIAFSLCMSHATKAMTYDKVFATNCLTPKNSIELKAYNKHTLDHNFKSTQQQLKTATTPTIKKNWLKRLEYFARPDVSSGYFFMSRNILGTIYEHYKLSQFFEKNRSEILERSQLIKEKAFPEQWNMVKELCTQIGVNSSAINMAYTQKIHHGSPASASRNTIFFSEDLLKMSIEQQKAILAHEIIHLKYHDDRINTLFNLISPALTTSMCLGSSLGIKKLSLITKNKLSDQGWNKSANAVGCAQKITCNILNSPLTHFITSVLLQLRYSRYQEKQADIESAKLCGTAAGMQAALQWADIEIQKSSKESNAGYPRLKNINERLYNSKQLEYLTTHPLPQTRIEYLQPYVTQ